MGSPRGTNNCAQRAQHNASLYEIQRICKEPSQIVVIDPFLEATGKLAVYSGTCGQGLY